MHLCTCNNCGNVWEDVNPGPDSKDYPETAENLKCKPLISYEPEGEGNGWTYACPECKTDGYLVDNRQILIAAEATGLI